MNTGQAPCECECSEVDGDGCPLVCHPENGSAAAACCHPNVLNVKIGDRVVRALQIDGDFDFGGSGGRATLEASAEKLMTGGRGLVSNTIGVFRNYSAERLEWLTALISNVEQSGPSRTAVQEHALIPFSSGLQVGQFDSFGADSRVASLLSEISNFARESEELATRLIAGNEPSTVKSAIAAEQYNRTRDYLVRIQEIAESVGVDLAEVIEVDGLPVKVFDFVLPTLGELVVTEGLSVGAIVSGANPKLSAALALPDEPKLAGMDDGSSSRFTMSWLVSKLLSLAGLDAIKDGLIATLEEEGMKGVWAKLWKAINEGAVKEIIKLLRKLLEKFFDKKFLDKLGKKIGAKALAKLMGDMAGKCAPFVGWLLLAIGIAWGLYKQFTSGGNNPT